MHVTCKQGRKPGQCQTRACLLMCDGQRPLTGLFKNVSLHNVGQVRSLLPRLLPAPIASIHQAHSQGSEAEGPQCGEVATQAMNVDKDLLAHSARAQAITVDNPWKDGVVMADLLMRHSPLMSIMALYCCFVSFRLACPPHPQH